MSPLLGGESLIVMIKFFRRIRQKLLTENKFSKYLLYAIGEIVLVVIGILLALAINNWNNERQLRSNNKIFLTKMLKDLNTNQKRWSVLVSDSIIKDFPTLNEAIKASDSIIKLTYLGLNKSHVSYLMTARIFGGNPTLNTNDNTYEELRNTAKIYSLGSESLVEAITDYYKLCEREEHYNLLNSRDVNNGLIKFQDGFGRILLDYDLNVANFNINDYPFYFDKNSKEYLDYQIGMAFVQGGQYQNMIKIKELIIATNALKQQIKMELHNK